jgi:hypothetical protein
VVAAVGLTVACAAPSVDSAATPAASVPAVQAVVETAQAAPATQWTISCEPGQQARIVQVVHNGVPTSEASCVDVTGRAQAAAPSRWQPAPVSSAAPAYVAVNDGSDEIVYQPQRPVRTQPAVYTTEQPRERVVREQRPKRSVAKSAIIIGSSAGAGAGVGAIVGGKKGALIGAAIGGGGAAIWDQVTRRKD